MARSSNRWLVVIGMLVMILVPTAIVVGVTVGASDPDGPHTPPAVVQSGQPGSVGATRQRADSEPSIDTDERRDAHQVMLDQMRVNVTPQMVDRMNAEPLTHSPAELAELERQAADIERMLAQNP